MKKIVLYMFVIFALNSCAEIIVDSGKEVKFNDPKLQPFLLELGKINRDSIGFSNLDSNSKIFYKEEYQGKVIKLFFERPNFLRIIYFDRINNKIIYRRENEETKGLKKIFVNDIDGYKSEIQETISIIYDTNNHNLFGKHLLVQFLDIDKYPDKNKYQEKRSKYYPSYIYETEISIEQAKAILANWKLSKLNKK